MKKIVIVSDLQVPYHDPVAVSNLTKFIKVFKPDQVVTIGDEIDLPQISRWEEGRMGSYAQTLDDDRNLTVDILWDLQVSDVIRSNHTDRLYNVIMAKIPSFAALPELRFEKFLKFDELGITFHKNPMPIAPNWIAVHGDHTPIKPQGGLSALEGARRHGKNVISGHTHRAGRSAFTEASGGRIGRVLHGVEVGNLMDFKQAAYTKGSANWQQAFAIMYVDKKNVQVDIIHIEKDGTFIVSGKRYGRGR
jgi:hypothetical protein